MSRGTPELSKEDLSAISAKYRAATGKTGAFSSFANSRAQQSRTSGSGVSASGGYANASAYSGYGGGSSSGLRGTLPRRVPSRLDEAVELAEQEKAEGTALFQSGQYFAAYQAWKRGSDTLESFESDGFNEEGKRLMVALCCNAAQALLKCPEVEGAATEMAASIADKALALEPLNVKALFRRGCAYQNAQGWLLARKDFEQVLRLDPANDAAKRELQKMEDQLPPTAPEVLAARRREEEASASTSTVTVPRDPEAAVRMAQKEAERFRREVLALADKRGSVSEWCRRFNKIQVMTADWAKQQLADPETVEDLIVLRGPLFQAMNSQQREDFLCSYDFVQEVQQRHGDEIEKLTIDPNLEPE
eukprot:TRINITY_DN4572_c2_g1_i1.p1 TRINITY_DN4572_c2_g1~~TRINITY_DN4572_c2_g1_i1.p1  ORF type:complete len:362 (+),score=80.54 TRINITY_DN4572_c2_g1_i1:69-1154(+)